MTALRRPMALRFIVPRLWPRGRGGLGARWFAASLFSTIVKGRIREPERHPFVQLRLRLCRLLQFRPRDHVCVTPHLWSEGGGACLVCALLGSLPCTDMGWARYKNLTDVIRPVLEVGREFRRGS